jgi:p-hydroxybenzoate 3-monooxygenase
MRTQVVIVGAGPAGLLLGHILRQAGVGFVILEERSRERVLARIRAGVLEQGSVDVLRELELDAGLRAGGVPQNGIHLQFDGRREHIDFPELVGSTVTVYGQQQLVADLVHAHEAAGSALVFEAAGVTPEAIEGSHPRVTYRDATGSHEVECDIVVGADGYHGVCRSVIPAGAIEVYERGYPFGWLGIIAEVAPSTDDVLYALHADGFAMHSLRSRSRSRLYLQVAHDEVLDEWSDARIWDALHTRLELPGWTLAEGPIIERSVAAMRSFVVSTMRHGRLLLAGDAAHIVPPTGAKGLNSAIADVVMLGRAILENRAGDDAGLESYSERALSRQWRIQQFSQRMTEMLHVHHELADPRERAFRYRSQIGELEYLVGSLDARRALAEQHTGIAFD